MVFGFIKLCRKLAMSQVFYCTYFLPFLKKKYVYIKLSLFFHPCSTFYPVSPCQGFLLMVQSKRMPLGKHYQYCCKADAPTAKKKTRVKEKRNERYRAWFHYPLPNLLPLATTCLPACTGGLGDCWGRGGGGVFSFRGRKEDRYLS